jgi:hypothetical protein
MTVEILESQKRCRETLVKMNNTLTAYQTYRISAEALINYTEASQEFRADIEKIKKGLAELKSTRESNTLIFSNWLEERKQRFKPNPRSFIPQMEKETLPKSNNSSNGTWWSRWTRMFGL